MSKITTAAPPREQYPTGTRTFISSWDLLPESSLTWISLGGLEDSLCSERSDVSWSPPLKTQKAHGDPLLPSTTSGKMIVTKERTLAQVWVEACIFCGTGDDLATTLGSEVIILYQVAIRAAAWFRLLAQTSVWHSNEMAPVLTGETS